MVQGDTVLFEVREQVVCAQHPRDLDQLIVVVLTMEKGFLPENLDIHGMFKLHARAQ
jgi:hypothetical protein